MSNRFVVYETAGRLGKRLRLAREDARFTQRDIAKIINVSNVAIQHYEAGRNRIKHERLILIARATNKPLKFFGVD